MDRGFFITLQSVRRQLAAMPNDFYLLRLIHHHTHKPWPMQPLWTAVQLSRGAMVRFLRLRNREGFDIYIRPYVENRNAGYILLDLDLTAPSIIQTMRASGHQPCVVVQTSPSHLQAWVRIQQNPIEPALATAIGRHLALRYGADLASTDWCHLGRLAGFTNQKPLRRQPNGYAPWVRLLHAHTQLATQGLSLIQAAEQPLSPSPAQPLSALHHPHACPPHSALPSMQTMASTMLTPAAAAAIYHRFLNRLRIPQRFPQPDWSIADLWIAKELFRCRTPAHQILAILQLGSPGFPRRHSEPDNYLARTLRRAARDVEHTRFSARPAAPPVLSP